MRGQGALADYLLDSVYRDTVLHRGTEALLEDAELSALVKHISQARTLVAAQQTRSIAALRTHVGSGTGYESPR